MSEMLKIAGKDTGGNAKGFLVETDGKTIVSRPWGTTVNLILDGEELRDANAHSVTGDYAIEIGNYPINSLRIRSTLDQNVAITFYEDTGRTSSTYIDNLGDTYALTIEAGNTHWQLVSPDELKLLEYGKYLKFKYQAVDAPTTGKLWICHVGKG